MYRVQFDTNEGTHLGGYWISRREIAAMGDDVCNGLHVVIVMPDEIEMQAVLAYDADGEFWKAIPVQGPITYLDGSS